MSTQPSPTFQPTSSDEDLASPRDFSELWKKALRLYEKETGNDLLKHPVAKNFTTQPSSADEVMEQFKSQKELFKVFRGRGDKIREVLKPIVDIVLFLKENAEGASDAVPGGSAMFSVIGVLLQATKGVSALYDTVESLFDEIKGSLERISLHLPKSSTPRTSLPPALTNILVDILVLVFTATAIATKYCALALAFKEPWFRKVARILFRRAKDYVLVLTDKTDVRDVLDKLQKLAVKEAQVVAAHTNAMTLQPHIEFVYDEAVVNGINTWLRPPNPKPANYDKKNKPGSCQWFIANEDFERWKVSKRDVYWVHGNAGAGKSVLCSSVLDVLRKDAERLLVYFYIDYSVHEQREGWDGLISSLIFQLGTGLQPCFDSLKAKWTKYWKADIPPHDRPPYQDLLDILMDLLFVSGSTVLVIDALDELPESTRRAFLFPFLERLRLLDLNKGQTRLFITSRPEPDIWRHCMMGPVRFATHDLDLDGASQHRGELDVYVSRQLSTLHLSRWPIIKAKAEDILVEKANGMFLWVDLQIPRLRSCMSEQAVEDTLQKLPIGIQNTYQRILENVDASDDSIQRARRVFECIASAKRLLSLAEVMEIFSVNVDSAVNAHSPLDLGNDDEDIESLILQLCPGLLDVVPSKEGSEKSVQFIHFSVHEYLMSPELRKPASRAHPYSFDEHSATLTLAKVCLVALDVNTPLPNMQKYADIYWDDHVTSRNEDAIGELLVSFLRMGSPSFTRWAGVRWESSDTDTVFHCAARLGLCRHVKYMLENSRQDSSTTSADALIKTRNRYEATALHHAAEAGQTDMCRVLLDCGALADDTDDYGWTPLHNAARNGHLDVVRLLLEQDAVDGADPAARCRAREKHGWTALYFAAWRGHAEVARLLLSHGALVDDATNGGRTPLHVAGRHGHIDVVRVLLEHRAKGAPPVPPLESGLGERLRERAEEDPVDGPWRAIVEDFASQFEAAADGDNTSS